MKGRLSRGYNSHSGGYHDVSSCSSRFGDQNILFLHDSECFHFYLDVVDRYSSLKILCESAVLQTDRKGQIQLT
jgi:hypothetical protein